MRLFLVFLVALFIHHGAPQTAEATGLGAPVELGGWAWSATIGWISMNCANTTSCAADGGFDYVVEVNTDSSVTGYAWSPNIGWIKFGGLAATPGFTSFPSGAGTASTDAQTTGLYSGTLVFEGWARACAGTINGDCSSMTDDLGGWDGWISLDGTGYGISMDTSGGVSPSFAWGSDVVGWIDFTGITYGAAPAPLPSNLTPIAINATQCGLTTISPPPATAGQCGAMPVTMQVRNDSGRDLLATESFPYEFGYREINPAGPWTVADSGTFSGFVAMGDTFTVNGSITGLPQFGAYEVRGTIDGKHRVMTLTRDPFPETQPVPPPGPTVDIGPIGDPYGTLSLFTGLGGTASDLVRSGTVVPVSWIVDSALPLECIVRGPGVSISFIHDPSVIYPPTVSTDTTAAPSEHSSSLANTATFEMRCEPQAFNRFVPPAGLVYITSATVEVIPDTQEI